MMTVAEFNDKVQSIKNNPNFKKLSRSSRNYFENNVDDLLDTLGGLDDDDVKPYSKESIEKIFSVKVRYSFSKKNEMKAAKLFTGFQALLNNIR